MGGKGEESLRRRQEGGWVVGSEGEKESSHLSAVLKIGGN